MQGLQGRAVRVLAIQDRALRLLYRRGVIDSGQLERGLVARSA